MGFIMKIFLLAVPALIAVIIGFKIANLIQPAPIPELEETWWGPGKSTTEDKTVKPFKINVTNEVLQDLQQRLKNARPFTPSLEGTQQQYGMNTNLLKEIVEFWKTKYNWRERETFLNQFNQFTTKIQGLKIHYLHVKPKTTKNVRVLPLLLIHGWPGSVREFYNMIPHLTTPQDGYDFVFEVIVPSLPGYGFSDGAAKPGLGPAQVAVVFKNLMERLGYKKYYIQGGDWGSIVASNMAILFENKVKGVHSNICIANTPLARMKTLLGAVFPSLVVDKKKEYKMYPLSNFLEMVMREFGYCHIQATKPDTVGVGLNDSPVGLAAYILEKFTSWTNMEWQNREDGGLTMKYSYTDLLDNVMLYWVTGTITTSVRLYSEFMNKAQYGLGLESIPILVPTACAKFEHEIVYHPDSLLKEKYPNMLQSTEFPTGGHFAAFEEPKLFSDDVWSAVAKFEEYHATRMISN